MMENPSGLDPRGVAVLIKTYEPERKGGMIEIPDNVQGRLAMVDNRAVVVAIGPSAWHDEPTPRAEVGEKVLVTKFAGFMAKGPKDGQMYRLVNDRDIFCAITDDGDSNG
ncbi:MAG: co-chaperone GroES family protein [Candidatus Binatia bacterium]|nr:co-chaperone GroES family protein [Candidatus Binatia bacterium]